MKPYSFHRLAREEFLSQLSYYSRVRQELAQRFVAEVDFALAEISRAPERHPFIEAPMRRIRLRKFPFALIYVEKPNVVQVLAVAHLSRKPGYWWRRTQG